VLRLWLNVVQEHFVVIFWEVVAWSSMVVLWRCDTFLLQGRGLEGDLPNVVNIQANIVGNLWGEFVV
jgi:hypothetical protein